MAEHRALFAALKSGDEAVSAQAAKSHVLVQGQRFTDLISLLHQRRLQPSDN
jgi:DNA-binding GntR family transcriptional regulator